MKPISCNQEMGDTDIGFCAQEPHRVLLGIILSARRCGKSRDKESWPLLYKGSYSMLWGKSDTFMKSLPEWRMGKELSQRYN